MRRMRSGWTAGLAGVNRDTVRARRCSRGFAVAAETVFKKASSSGLLDDRLFQRRRPDLVVAGFELGGDGAHDFLGRARALGLLALAPLADVIVGRAELATRRDDVDQLLEALAEHLLRRLAALARVDLRGDFLPVGHLVH